MVKQKHLMSKLAVFKNLFFISSVALISSNVIAVEKNASVAIGPGYTLIVLSDGELWGWGNNASGSLGDGSTINRKVPVFIANGFKQVATAGGPILAVKVDGSLWSWGQEYRNDDNSLPKINKKPVQIGSGFAMVAQGTWESIAVDNDGALFGWGGVNAGCGLAMIDEEAGKRKLLAFPSKLNTGLGYKNVAVAESYAIALKSDGALWSWGINGGGQLGRPDQSKYDSGFECYPVRKIGDGFTSVATGASAFGVSLAIKMDGSLWGWGSGNSDALMGEHQMPVWKPILLGKGYTKVVIGGGRAFGIKTDGSLWAWGNNQDGFLGDGSRINQKKPVKIGDDYIDVFAAQFSAIAIKKDGSIWTWGENSNGELGDGTTIQRPMPIRLKLK